MARKLEVEIVGDAKSLERAFGRAAHSSSGFGRSLKSLGKVAAVGVGAAFAGLAATLKVGFDELSEGQQVMAQTNAALKSTGGAANVTAKEVAKLAEAQSRLTGIDDEAVQAGENMLLTFTKIRNEVGKGNDIFNQATVAIEDMATRMNDGAIPSAEQLSTTAIRVGKALNDPIKGMTALSRVGVQFDESQRKAIKSMVEAGDTMGAQKLILAELTKEFGGSAKAAGDTLPGQLSKLRNSFDEVAGSVAETLLPYLIRFLDWVNVNMPTIQKVIQTTLDAVVAVIEFLIPIISKLIGWFQTLSAAAQKYWPVVQQAAERVIAWYRANVAPAIQNIVAAVTAIWRKFGDDLVNIIGRALGVLKTVIGTALGNIASIIQAILALIRGDWSTAWNEIKEIPIRTLKGAVAAIRGLAGLFLAAAKALGQALIEGIVAGLSGLADMVRDKITSAVSSAISGVKSFFGIGSPSKVTQREIGLPLAQGILLGFLDGAKDFPKNFTDKTKAAIEAARQAVEGAKSAFGQAFADLMSVALEAFDARATLIETRTERMLRLMDEAARKSALLDDVAEAERKLQEAMAARGGITQQEGESTEDFVARLQAANDAVAEAEKALADARMANNRFYLEKQAEQERKALDDRLAMRRKHFEEDLANLQEYAAKHTLTAEQLNQRLIAIFKKYHVPFRNAAINLGHALAEGLQEAADEVGRQARAVREQIMRYLSNIQIRINVDVTVPDRNTDGRQHGGPVRMGSPYIVGEAGPEIFVPRRSGQIIPNSQAMMSRAGGGSVFNLNFYGPAVGTSREWQDLVRRAFYDVQRLNPGTGFA